VDARGLSGRRIHHTRGGLRMTTPSPSGGLRGPRKHRVSELLLILLAVVISAGAYTLVGVGTTDEVPANVYSYTAWLAVLGVGIPSMGWWRAPRADSLLVPAARLLTGRDLALLSPTGMTRWARAANPRRLWG